MAESNTGMKGKYTSMDDGEREKERGRGKYAGVPKYRECSCSMMHVQGGNPLGVCLH